MTVDMCFLLHSWAYSLTQANLPTHPPTQERLFAPQNDQIISKNIKQYLFTLSKWAQICLLLVNCSEKTCNLRNHPAHLWMLFARQVREDYKLHSGPPSVFFERISCKMTRLKIPSRPVMKTAQPAHNTEQNDDLWYSSLLSGSRT
jgi:hypothetical protein